MLGFYEGAGPEMMATATSEKQRFYPRKAGRSVGVGRVKALVIGSGCPGPGSDPVCHAAFATNETADRNSCMSPSCGRKGQSGSSTVCG